MLASVRHYTLLHIDHLRGKAFGASHHNEGGGQKTSGLVLRKTT